MVLLLNIRTNVIGIKHMKVIYIHFRWYMLTCTYMLINMLIQLIIINNMGLYPQKGKGPQADATNTSWQQLLLARWYYAHTDPLWRLNATSSWVNCSTSCHQEGPYPCWPWLAGLLASKGCLLQISVCAHWWFPALPPGSQDEGPPHSLCIDTS